MTTREEQSEYDLMVLSALYYGNHLEPKELERARRLVYMLDIEFKSRVKL
jgi:hypothetical protein